MADIPRRLPPTPAERLNVVVSRMAGGSAAGTTRWAQPVTNTDTYRPAASAPAASAPPPASTPMFVLQQQGSAITYDDGTTYYDQLSLPGFNAGRLYFVEIKALVSNSEVTDQGTGGVALRLAGPTPDNGTTQLFVDYGAGIGPPLNLYDPVVVSTYNPESDGVNQYDLQFIIGVSYFAAPTSALTLQACGVAIGRTIILHPTTYIRASDIGAVAQIS